MSLSRWSSRHKKTFNKRKKKSGMEILDYHLNQIVIILKQKVVVVGVETQILNEDGTINTRKT